MLIELKKLEKTYRPGDQEVPVLRGIDLQIAPGEYVTIMGSSGSGKSTLMNILGCLDRSTAGQYLFEGRDVMSLSGDERAHLRNGRIGFIFQSFNLLPRTTVLENVVMPLTYSEVPVHDDEAYGRARELLSLVGLKQRMDFLPSQLSGGQQQRVAIARALINRPSLLLADEPTGNLDSAHTEDILRLFDDLRTEGKITIIVVTHEHPVAERAKRVIHIKDGQIDGDSRPAEAFQS